MCGGCEYGCQGAYDVAVTCDTCLANDSCPSCDQCESTNSETCDKYDWCKRCNNCNTRCDTCQALCQSNPSQVYKDACGNAGEFPQGWQGRQGGENGDIIVKTFSQGKFLAAWEWIRALINYGAEQGSPGSSNPPSAAKGFLYADDYNKINDAINSIKAGNTTITEVEADVDKVKASTINAAGQILLNLKLNKIACHYQNTKWETCGPTSSECCQYCLTCNSCKDCMRCDNTTTNCPSCTSCVTCTTCEETCKSCQACNSCQGTNTCSSCNNCNNCVSEETG